jgi:hypothetical protein
MTAVSYAEIYPQVGFNLASVALYLVPAGEPRRARHLAIQLPRDGERGEDCPNVRYVRALEIAASMQMHAQIDKGMRGERPAQ